MYFHFSAMGDKCTRCDYSNTKRFLIIIFIWIISIFIVRLFNDYPTIQFSYHDSNKLMDHKFEYNESNVTVAIVSFPGTKYNVKESKEISVNFISDEVVFDRNLFPSMSKFNAIFDYGLRNKSIEKEYTFENYREDISLSLDFYFLLKLVKLDEYDFVFIPPIGMKFNEEILNELYEQIIYVKNNFKNYCYVNTLYTQHKNNEMVKNNNFTTLKSVYPQTLFSSFSGILIEPQQMRRMEYFGRVFFHIDRFDRNLQIFCDIGDLPIILVPNKSRKLPIVF